MSKRTIEQFHASTTATVKQIQEALADWPDDAVVTAVEVIVEDERRVYQDMATAHYFIELSGERVISQ